MDFLVDNSMEWPLLSLLIALPFASALICGLLPKKYQSGAFGIAALCLGIEVIAIGFIFTDLESSKGLYLESNFLWVERHLWFSIDGGDAWGTLEVEYLLGIDGLSGPLLLLAAVLFLVGGVASRDIAKRPRLFFSMYLLLFGAVVGALCSLDLMLFFLFFEFLVLPTYVLIAGWGTERRSEAALQFLLYSISGSLMVFFVLLGLYASVEMPSPYLSEGVRMVHRLDLSELINRVHYLDQGLLTEGSSWQLGGVSLRTWSFWALLIGFAIKLPVIPLHAWLPKAHVEASTGVSIVLAGVLLKLAGYAIMRVGFVVFTDQMMEYASVLAVVGACSIVYAGLNALVQQDLKRMVAYASISHMGFVLLGIASLSSRGLTGAIYQMISHGLITAALFFWIGALEKRCGTRQLSQLGGLAQKMPVLASFAALFAVASFGVPGFSSFWAEFLILSGTLEAIISHALPWVVGILPLGGILLAAAYSIWTLKRVFQGKYMEGRWPPLKDLRRGEVAVLSFLAVAVLFLGVYPQPFLEAVNGTVQHLRLLIYTYQAIK